MSVVIFCGPSLAQAECQRLYPEADVVDPAECGDIYRAFRCGATAIGLIDGYFDQRLAVWHKEILWVLEQQVPVYGAASMGALRAAELCDFGMIGLGVVFDLYRRGELEDDDEVAVVHEPKERGFKARSEAMVNVRATLALAAREGVVSRTAADALLTLSKQQFYADRNYTHIVQLARLSAAIADRELDILELWLKQYGPVPQKSLDAVLLLRTMRDNLTNARPVSSPRFRFANTNAWQTLRERIDEELRSSSPQSEPSLAVWSAALERTVALLIARIENAEITPEQAQHASDEFRRERNLLSEEQTHAWLTRRGLSIQGFSELVRDEVLAQRMRPRALALAQSQVFHVLQAEAGLGRTHDVTATGG
jgi:hypothetical protein